MKRYKHTREKKATERVSFYIALSVCMMAIGLAVWSAYSTFTEQPDEDESYFSSLSSTTVAAAQEMTGVTEPVTEAETVIETEAPTIASSTEAAESKRSIMLSETEPEDTAEAGEQSDPDGLQAVLKVEEDLIYPVKSHTVTKPYSEKSVYNKTMKDHRAHTGCDFAAEEGENVYSMCPGKVKDISVSELYGVIIEVDCGDYSIYYCGLSSEFAVDKGDELNTGDTIGKVGQIPSESADVSHIHIEIRVGSRLIDPLSVIDSES